MPVKVVKRSGSKPWKIVEVTGGRVVGSSDSKGKAQAAARIRNSKSRK